MKKRKSAPANATWFAIHRADKAALRSRWIGPKYCTRLAVYVEIIETANYLGRRQFTLTRDRISAGTGLCARRLTEIVHDLHEAKLLILETRRKPSGEFAPWGIELCGKTQPRQKNTERGDTKSSGPWDILDSDKCPHSYRNTPTVCVSNKKINNSASTAEPGAATLRPAVSASYGKKGGGAWYSGAKKGGRHER